MRRKAKDTDKERTSVVFRPRHLAPVLLEGSVRLLLSRPSPWAVQLSPRKKQKLTSLGSSMPQEWENLVASAMLSTQNLGLHHLKPSVVEPPVVEPPSLPDCGGHGMSRGATKTKL